MAHVWNVIDGDIYVSKNGDDVTGDGTMANPYASINKATTVGAAGNKIVIGTGVWEEARGTSANKYHFIGDGDVIFGYQQPTYFIAAVTNGGGGDVLENIKIKNGGIKNLFPKFTTNLDFVKCIGCEIDYICGGLGSYQIIHIERCLVKKVYGINNRNNSITFYSFNSVFLDIELIVAAYGMEYKFLIIQNSIILNWNVTGAASTCQVLSQEKNLIYKNPNNSLYLFNDYINLDPLFNNPAIGDYTLQPTSPCLFSGKNNTTIGAFGLGYSFDANSYEFTKEGGAVFSQTTLVDDIIRTNQVINGVTRFLFQLASGHASGNVESVWIDLQTIRYLLITRLFANIIYNAAGVATSRPDNLETAGEKAVFYDFELKYCNEESEKATAAWKNVIWNKAVTIDNTERGNADPAFVASEAKYISARFIKIKLYMTEV